jgi:dipeptidyl aminopeptidase/acylaminoacyl peptidase
MMMKQVSVFEDFSKFESLSSGEYHAKTEQIVYGFSGYDEVKNKRVQEIRLKDLKTGAIHLVTANGQGEGSPAFSPDGTCIAFLSVVPGMGRQIFVKNMETDELSQITKINSGAIEPVWSPDGESILFASVGDANKPEPYYTTRHENENKKNDEAVVITDFGYKFDGMGFIKPEHLHLWVVQTKSGVPKRITDGDFDYLHHTWSPDGKSVLCVSNRFRSKKDSIASDLILIDIAGTKEMKQLTSKNWTVSYPNPVRPIYTPDGKNIVMGFLDSKSMEPNMQSHGYPPAFLHRVSVNGADDVCLMEETRECYDGVSFPYNSGCGVGMDKVRISSDGQYAYFLSGYEGQNKLFKVALYLEEFMVIPVLGGKRVIGGLGKPQDGKMLLSISEPDKPEGYYLFEEETGKLTLLVQSNETYLSEKAISTPEEIYFLTLDEESHVHGFVLPPQNREEGQSYPCILYIHGGPHPFYTYGFTLEHQCLAGNGFGVIYCNPRGSSGYGSVHRNLERAMDGSAYMDILQFTEEACRKFDWIDRARLGVTGGSYGGYMTNYIATHSQRFKAFVTQRSVCSDLIGYASSDMQGDSLSYPNFEEFMIEQIKNSTVSYVERIQAPFLILHGMEDYRTPVEGAHQLFVALKDLHPDLPVKMVLYPHTNHDQPRHPKQQLHYHHQILEWFLKYL